MTKCITLPNANISICSTDFGNNVNRGKYNWHKLIGRDCPGLHNFLLLYYVNNFIYIFTAEQLMGYINSFPKPSSKHTNVNKPNTNAHAIFTKFYLNS